MDWHAKIRLQGTYVTLEPLSYDHLTALAKHATPDLFAYMTGFSPQTISEESVRPFLDAAFAMANRVPFAIVAHEVGEAVGTTSYLDIRPEHRSLEVGYTWLAKPFQGTRINPEAKLLLMTHAFEVLEAVRVQLKTDARNLQSQRGIEKLGAVKEGVLRRHTIMPDGFVRDTVMYSITDDEWPAAKTRLLARLS